MSSVPCLQAWPLCWTGNTIIRGRACHMYAAWRSKACLPSGLANAAAAGHCGVQLRRCRGLQLLPATHMAAAAVQLLRTRIQATAGLGGKGHSQGHPSDRSSHTAGAPRQKQHFKEAVLKLHSEAQVCWGSMSV